MHHLATLLVSILTFASGLHVLAQTTTTLSYDNHYDDAELSLDDVACSGLKAKGYTTLGSLPAFPSVGGVYTVSGSDSTECGACYAVTYGSTTVNILAVDRSTTGFTVSEEAMNTLTGGQAAALGRMDVSFVSVDPSGCNM